MSKLHSLAFPNESADYRAARDRLLEAEAALRRQTEEVAALRRALPSGGQPSEDYAFERAPADARSTAPAHSVRLSELFVEGRDTLVLYNFMLPPGGRPCPMCTAFLDGLSGNVAQLAEYVTVAIVARAPAHQLRRWADLRGWRFAHVLSSGQNGFNRDYHAENEDGDQWPILHVFRRENGGVRHHWSSELFFAPAEEGQHPRHIDVAWPLWNVLDLTPEGRGVEIPVASYQESLAAFEEAENR